MPSIRIVRHRHEDVRIVGLEFRSFCYKDGLIELYSIGGAISVRIVFRIVAYQINRLASFDVDDL